MSSVLRCVVFLAFAIGAASCSSDKSNTSSPPKSDGSMASFCDLGPACRQISMACMPKDDGSASMVHTCHVAGMETAVESQCEQMLNSCVTACNAAPGFGDAGGFDALPVCEGGT